jgi:hypothetical protein
MIYRKKKGIKRKLNTMDVMDIIEMISSWLFPHAKFNNVFVLSTIALTFASLLIIS